jgi:molybdopterin/thiamine biosynthesis adenylyltransferase
MNGNIYIIGAGGVGSWLAYSLCKLVDPKQVILMDGDTLETRNLDRQLFGAADVGKNKAAVLGQRLGCLFLPQYFSSHTRDYGPMDWLICCADNNAARRACLDDADRAELAVIIAANEKTSAEAYYYDPYDDQFEFEGPLDPRVYYPELLTDNAPDPRATAIGCVGEAQKQTPQLVSANFMAAALAQWLFVLWALEVPKMPDVELENLPNRLVANASRLETHLIRDALRKDNK